MEQVEPTIERTALAVGLIILATLIAMTIVSTGHIRLYATIAGLLVGYLAAIILGVIDAAFLENLRDLPWFGLPAAPALDLAFSPILIVPSLIATIASNIQLVGLISSAQRTKDVNWRPPDMDSLRGGIVAGSTGRIPAG